VLAMDSKFNYTGSYSEEEKEKIELLNGDKDDLRRFVSNEIALLYFNTNDVNKKLGILHLLLNYVEK
jgi:hypothetical protein